MQNTPLKCVFVFQKSFFFKVALLIGNVITSVADTVVVPTCFGFAELSINILAAL